MLPQVLCFDVHLDYPQQIILNSGYNFNDTCFTINKITFYETRKK